MINKKTLIVMMLSVGLAIAAVMTTGCRSKVINPNGSSELAVHMRDLNEDVLRMREQVGEGLPVTVRADPEFILNAEPTEAGKNQREDYIAYANSYIHMVEMLKTAGPDDARLYYTGMVNSCLNCHRSMCPGPVVRIKKLHLK